MALLQARLLLNVLINESAMLVQTQGQYFLVRRGRAFRLNFVPEPLVAQLLWENLIAPATDDDWGWEILVPTAEGRRTARGPAPDNDG